MPYKGKDLDTYGQFNDVKNTNPDLKTLLAVGGKGFSQMVSLQANRAVFINSVIT